MWIPLTRGGLAAASLAAAFLCGAPAGARAGEGTAPLLLAQSGPIVREIIGQRPVVREVIVRDDAGDRAFQLHEACQAGDRGACVRFGIMIGQHQERRAEWQRAHPAMFWWDH